MAELEIDGRRLAWRSVGRGSELLLVNGYAATGEDWDPTFLAELSAAHRVICPDNRGLGGSDLGDGELTVDGMAADLELVLDAEGIERLPVVGWSMGGFVAQRLAECCPGRVSALALIATDPGGPGAVVADPRIWSRLVDHSGTSREQASRLIELLFPAALAVEIDRQFGGVVAATRAKLSPQALTAQEAAMEAWHRQARAPAVDDLGLATLIVHGSDDVVIPAENAALLAERWPGSKLEIFESAGHAVMAQEPQRVGASICSHLDG